MSWYSMMQFESEPHFAAGLTQPHDRRPENRNLDSKVDGQNHLVYAHTNGER